MLWIVLTFGAIELFGLTKGGGPKYQKFDQTGTTGSSKSTGVAYSLGGDTTVDKFTIIAWIKYSSDPSVYSPASNNVDTLFALYSPTENHKRLVVGYKIRTGLIARLGENVLTPTESNIITMSTDTSNANYINRRNHWHILMISVTGSGDSHLFSYKFGFLEDIIDTDTNVFSTNVTVIKSESAKAIGNTALQADTQLYIGGYGPIGAFPTNPDYGGCTQIRNLVVMMDYEPLITDSDSLSLMNHMIELSSSPTKLIMEYSFRIKNVKGLNLVKEGDVSLDVSRKMENTENTYIKNGIHINYGDYLEGVNNNMIPVGDVVLSFKFYYSETPKIPEISLISFVYKKDENFKISSSLESGKLPIYFNLIKFGVFLTSENKLKIYNMGISKTLSTVLSLNKGYTITIIARRHYDSFWAEPANVRRLFVVYINDVIVDQFTIVGDFGIFQDVKGDGTSKNNYFYIGDYITRGIGRYNYVFISPNPLNSFVINNQEKVFDTAFIFIHDIMVFENATVTTEKNALLSNCLIGIPGTNTCFLGQPLYALTFEYVCKLKSLLPSYIVYTNKHDLAIEGGTGLFFNEVLKICQNGPSDCAVCNSISDGVIKIEGCFENGNRCDGSRVCIQCKSGYVYNSATNTCLQGLASDCDTGPLSNRNEGTKCKDTFFWDIGTSSGKIGLAVIVCLI